MVFCSLPATAGAHTAAAGLGNFASGLLHPVSTPTHLLVLLGVGLLAGQHSPLRLKTLLAVFIPVSAVALCLTTTGMVKAVYQPILIALALMAGTLVILGKPLPPFAGRMIFALAAVALGLDSAVETGPWPAIVKTLLGTWIGLVVVVTDLAFYASLFTKHQWQRVGLRVAGSWITAASLMILAFALGR
ncbi:MAG: HupE/UreJ family protein [Verrucomicrobiota bacterium]|jgi:hydrogenase/urease accessory protein HupE